MSKSTAETIRKIIADQAILDVSDVSAGQSLEELGIDSLGLIESIFTIEETFDIVVPFNANEPVQSEFDISTVASIVLAVEKLITEQAR